uniref:Bifunctional lysine-specific demethylase and histidyl-hydroxylase NO66 n=1 Tax=Drosophila rhopaloa TaxID=1041015 RepID=A0A6P4EJ40_DRORH
MSKELSSFKRSTNKPNYFRPANMVDLANQLFDKTKQMSMSIKDQRKLLQEYLSAKIEGSDESEVDSGIDSDSDSDSEEDSFSESESEDDSDSLSDEETEESSDESELESIDDEKKTLKPSPESIKKREKLAARELELSIHLNTKLVASVAPSKNSAEPQSRIQRRITMSGGLVASPIRKSQPLDKESEQTPKSDEVKSCQIANNVKGPLRPEDQKPQRNPSANCLIKSKVSDFSKEFRQTTIRLAD